MSDIDTVLRTDAAEWNKVRPSIDLDATFAKVLTAPLDAASASRARPKFVRGIPRHSSRDRLRPRHAALASVACGVALIALIVAVTTILDHRPSPKTPNQTGGVNASIKAIEGIVWKDGDSVGTVVYRAGSMRLFDGCTNSLNVLIVNGHTLTKGAPIGPFSSCVGSATVGLDRQARAALAHLRHFYSVTAGPATWQLHGRTLTLTSPSKGLLTLNDQNPAPEAVGTRWHLVNFMGANGDTVTYRGQAGLLISAGGTFNVGDGCRQLHGNASTTQDTITFKPSSNTKCSSPTAASTVIDSVIRGTVKYVVRGNQLILYGHPDGLLVYGTSVSGR